MIKCGSCGADNPEEAIFCTECSKRLMEFAGPDVESIDEKITERSYPTGFMGLTLSRGWWEIYAVLFFFAMMVVALVAFPLGWQFSVVFLLLGISMPMGWYFIYVPRKRSRSGRNDDSE